MVSREEWEGQRRTPGSLPPTFPARVEDGSSLRALWEQEIGAREVRPPPKHHPFMLPQDSPVPQARDAYQLDDIDPYLTKKYEEEHEEAERVVGPVERRGNPRSLSGPGVHSSVFLAWH